MYTYSEDYYLKRSQIRPKSSSGLISIVFKFIFRPVTKVFGEFCLWTSMHGFNHIALAGRHWIERLLWVLLTALAIWGAIDISLGQLQRYNENPTVVALEKDFMNWRFNLPAITACQKNRVDHEKLPEVIKSFWNVTPNNAKYDYYSNFVKTVANSDLYHLEGFQQYADDETLNVDMLRLVVEVVPEMMVKVDWSGIDPPLSTNPSWIPVIIETGACYTVNSLAIADITTTSENINETKMFPITCKYSPKYCSVAFGISTDTFDFYVHSNYDIADITSPAFRVILSQIRTTFLDVSSTRDGRGVSDLAPNRRGCRYTNEPKDNKEIFSTNTCRLSCRNNVAMKYCNCEPFYYKGAESKVCDVKGMVCLSNHAQQLFNNDNNRCICDQQCVDAIFKEISTTNKFWDQGASMNKGALKLIVQTPRTRYTREIIFHFQDLVVSFGGAAGLFLGASFISFMEIFYFILEKTLRLCIGNVDGETSKERKTTQDKAPYEAARIKELTRI